MSATYLSLNVHIVFATKDRVPTIDAAWRNDLHAYIGGTVRGLGGMPFAVGGVEDHVHIVAGLKATHAVADFVREVKKHASNWSSEQRKGFSWQTGYGAFSFGYRDLDATIRYVTSQEEHHRALTSTQELINLLEEFGVTYDKRYFE